VGKTKLSSKLFLLEPRQAQMLSKLALETRYSQSALVRQALDSLFEKYGKKGKGRPRE
jgi:ribbon-helix-helix protein